MNDEQFQELLVVLQKIERDLDEIRRDLKGRY
jgi:hypothetical protein